MKKKRDAPEKLLKDTTKALSLLSAALSHRVEDLRAQIKAQIICNGSEPESRSQVEERIEKSTRLIELSISLLPIEGFTVSRANQQLDKNREHLEAPFA